nr:retrovirus-related Pol polyprotein from transposon TNT 1-94 [Tanacetum cinerariifolium]
MSYTADESSVCNTLLPPLKKLDSAKPCDIRKPIWYVNSGCSRHMTCVKNYLHKYVKQSGPKVVFGDDSTCTTQGYGSIKCNSIVFIKFDEKRGTIFNSNKVVLMIALRVRDVYVLDMTSSAQESCFFAKASDNLNWLWHKRLAHLNFKTINKMVKQNLVIGLPLLVYSKDKPCSSCDKGKHHRDSVKTKQTSSIKKCLHLLHMELFRPIPPKSINHEKYTFVIANEYSRYTWVYFLKKKSQALETIMSFIKRVENQNDIKVKQLRTDNVSKAFRVFNTRRQQSEETYHITFDKTTNAIKFSKLSVDNIKIVKNERYPHDHNDQSAQTDEILNDDQPEHSNHTIDEQIIDNLSNTKDIQISEHLSSLSANDTLVRNIIFSLKKEPKKVSEALQHPESVDAMQDELNQFAKNKVWTLVPAPYGKTIIGSKWVFRNKRDETGIVIKNKERLVAQCYNQQEGIDYDKTFALVERLKAIRISLSFAIYMNLIVYQIDVKSDSLMGMDKETQNYSLDQKLKGTNPSVLVDKTKSVRDGLKNTHTDLGINEESRTDEILNKIKLEDLSDILKDTRYVFFTPNFPQDKPIIVSDKSEDEETKKDKDTHTNSYDVPKDTSVPHPPSPKSTQIQELMKTQWELPAKILDFPIQVSSVQKKLKTLDSLPILLNNVTNTLNRFSTVVENASGATSKDVPLPDQATASPAEEEKNTNPATKDDEPINLHNELVGHRHCDTVLQQEVTL